MPAIRNRICHHPRYLFTPLRSWRSNMSTILSTVAQQLGETELPDDLQAAGADLAALIEAEAYVGEIYSIRYEEALVQIDAYKRQQVVGISTRSLPVGHRIDP